MSEPRYTLAEARKVLHHARCVEQGHAYRVVIGGVSKDDPGHPTKVACDRCGEEWLVRPGDWVAS